jgi:hypothetical protein
MSIFATLAERSGAIGVALGWWSELRANRRAMVGLLLIVGLVVGDGFFLLRDATARMRANYDRELVRLQRVAAVAQERDWPQRAAASAEIRAALEGRLWAAESDGIARADLQDWVTGMARDIGLSTLEVRIELATPKSLPPDLRQITATITAQPSETALIALLERIERAPHLLVVDRLNVKQQPGPFLEMVLICYARIGPKIAADTAPGTAVQNSGAGGRETR